MSAGATLYAELLDGAREELVAALGRHRYRLWFRDAVFPGLGWLPLGGLALGFSLSNILEVGVLLWLLRRRLGGLDGRALLSAATRMSLAALVMAAAIVPALLWLPPDAVWARALGATALGGVAYLAASWLLGVEELRTLRAQAGRLAGRLRR